MIVVCHGVLIPIGMRHRHHAMTDLLKRELSRALRQAAFKMPQRSSAFGVSTAYATNPGTMAKPYYPSVLQHPNGKSFNLLIEAKTSSARRRSSEEFAHAAIVHVLDALIDYSIKNQRPFERLLRVRNRKTADPAEFFFWGRRLRERADLAVAKHERRKQQASRNGRRRSK